MIKHHNEENSLGKNGFIMEINEFGDMTVEEFRKTMNYIPVRTHTEGKSIRKREAGGVLPKSVNWRKKGYVTSVKKQAYCNSCWAFAVNGAIEGQMFKKTGNLTRLSVQNLVDCSKPHGNNGCDWGDPYIAYEYVLHNGGVEAEATYPYEGKTGEEYRTFLTDIPVPAAVKVKSVQNPLLNDLPKSEDWTKKGFVTPVRKQGQCGSCWAFAAIGAIEGQMFWRTGNLTTLSVQNLLDCSKPQGNNGCVRGDAYSAYQYVLHNGGLEAEETYPYEAKDGPCRYNPNNSRAYITEVVSLPAHEDYLLVAVSMIGPVAAAIDASHDSFRFYRGGIYHEPNCSSYLTNHAVLVVGYGFEGNETDGNNYWLIKNRALLPPGDMMTSGPELLPGVMSGNIALKQPGFVLMSMASLTTEGHVDNQDLVRPLSPCWCMRAMRPQEPCLFGWPILPPRTMVTSKPGLWCRAMSGSMALPQPGSELTFMASNTIKGHLNPQGLGHYLRLEI
ncbi:hypothetical protein NN561_015905 [Cricetulus griseus]